MFHRTHLYLAGFIAASTLSLRAADPVFPAAPGGNDFPTTIPCGKTLVIPIAVDDADNDPISFTVSSSNSKFMARVRTANYHYKMHVHTDNDGSVEGQSTPFDKDMEFQLYRDVTPDTADFIAGFAQSGYYDNVLFHRVIPEFVIQGGDPAGTGSGSSPYTIPHEFRPELIYTGRGQLAMANSQDGYQQTFPNNGNFRYRTGSFTPTNGSQFFVTLGQPRHLDFKHTLFGQLIRGFDTLDRIAAVKTDEDDNKPLTGVKMTTHQVSASKTDAVLLLSTTTTGTATITVTAKDPSGKTASKQFTITSVVDDTNDPPMLLPFEPVVAPAGSLPRFQIRSFDLEHDAITSRFPVQDIFSGGNVIYAGVNGSNLSAVARPDSGAWDVAIGVAGINDPLLDSDPFRASRFETLNIGVGDKAIEATAVTLEAEAATATGTKIIATFRHGSTSASPDDYAAVVNWGDGSALQNSVGVTPALTISRSATTPGTFEVRGDHTYARAGRYPLQVIIDGPLGATDTARGASVVSPTNAVIRPVGEELVFRGASFAGRPVAYFRDSTAGAKPADYSIVIDWGDGHRTPGSVRQVSEGRFAVFGTHRYVDAEAYSIATHIRRTGPDAEAVAWGRIQVTGFDGPDHLPPFSKASITCIWSSDPTKYYRGANDQFADIIGGLFLVNGGDKPTKKWKLRFWVTDDALLEKGATTARAVGTPTITEGGTGYKVGDLLTVSGGTKTTATTLVVTTISSGVVSGARILSSGSYSAAPTGAVSVTGGTGTGATFTLTYVQRAQPKAVKVGPLKNPLKELSLGSLPPGAGGNLGLQPYDGGDLTLRLPNGESGAGKFIIAELDYSDPITDRMKVPKAIPFGPLTGIITRKVVTQTKPFQLKEDGSNGQSTAEFTVKLDTLPTADVTIPLDVAINGTANTSRATLSTNQLVFTPANGTTEQTVTVTVVEDNIQNATNSVTVRLKAATSVDPRFSNMDGADVSVPIVDFPRNVVVTPASLTVTEGTPLVFRVKLQTKPTADVIVPLEFLNQDDQPDTSRASIDKTELTFTSQNGTTEQTVTVTPVNDLIVNGNATFKVRVKPAVSADATAETYNGRDGVDVTVVIQDNDTRGIEVSPDTLSVQEAGSPKTFSVRLKTTPTAEVRIPIEIVNGTDALDNSRATLNTAELVFTPENGTTAQLVTVTAVDDAAVNGTQQFKIKLKPAISADSNTTDYHNRDASDITLTVTDNDTP